MQFKGIIVIVVLAMVAVAVAARVGFLRSLVFGPVVPTPVE